MRIALITDPKRMDCPESIKKIYDKSLQQVTGCIVEAIKSLEHEVKHIIAKTDLQDKLIKFNPNLVFNRSNSIDPRSGFSATPTLLDKLQIPYTGPNAKKCVVAMNKFQTKNILKKLSIPTPKYILIDSANDIHIPEDMSFPLFIKLIKGGCSLGIERENLVFDKEQCMQPDLYLKNKLNNRIIILDTKFMPQTSKGYWKETFHSGNLYQIYAYLKTQEHISEIFQKAEGILLYPASGASKHSETINLQSHTIRIENVDLTMDWEDIEKNLLTLILGSEKESLFI